MIQKHLLRRAWNGPTAPLLFLCLTAGSWLAWAAMANGQPAATPPPASTVTGNGFLDIVFSGGWVGFSIILLLLALSMTAAFLVFEQLMSLRRGELIPGSLAPDVRALLTKGQVSQARSRCQQRPSLLSYLILNGLEEADGGWPAIQQSLEDSVAEQAARLFRKIEYLSVIGNIAPMVGLLGTVIGMIFAFQQVASTQGAAGAGELAEGIYQALITTVGGLLVAIPSLGAFAIFRNRLDQFVAEAAHAAQQALSPLKRRPRAAATAAGKRAGGAGSGAKSGGNSGGNSGDSTPPG